MATAGLGLDQPGDYYYSIVKASFGTAPWLWVPSHLFALSLT